MQTTSLIILLFGIPLGAFIISISWKLYFNILESLGLIKENSKAREWSFWKKMGIIATFFTIITIPNLGENPNCLNCYLIDKQTKNIKFEIGTFCGDYKDIPKFSDSVLLARKKDVEKYNLEIYFSN